jgi:hypothetical protein
MSRELKNSTGSVGTISKVTSYAPEIDALIGGTVLADVLTSTDETVEDAGVFAPEKHLEDFLLQRTGLLLLHRPFRCFHHLRERLTRFLADCAQMRVAPPAGRKVRMGFADGAHMRIGSLLRDSAILVSVTTIKASHYRPPNHAYFLTYSISQKLRGSPSALRTSAVPQATGASQPNVGIYQRPCLPGCSP